ncbi:TAFII55 protein conserved region-domain-containing protein [Chytriomyces sp. MP71]|nr:TAFII55 protein conserved region-domain-containing protein [Chytriomyces sp. MP71]
MSKPTGTVKLKREAVAEKADVLPPVEEHLILRVCDAGLATKLRQVAAKREPLDDLVLRFSEPRKGTLAHADAKYPMTLVDLPCIIESQKTWDNRQLYKICDISQMLVVEESSASQHVSREATADYVWPHGITAPLSYVRKRRFRKRIDKRDIEYVEREVERLLKADAEAVDVAYEELLDNPDQDDEVGNGTLESSANTPPENVDDEDGGGDDDFDLAAEVENALDEEGIEDGGEDEDEDEEEVLEDEEMEDKLPAGSDDEGSDDEDEGEDEEVRVLKEEIAELEDTIEEKHQQLQEQMNPIMRNRFEGIVRKLNDELVKKKAALSSVLQNG